MIENIKKQIENTIKANECGLSNNDFKEDLEALELLHDRYLKEKETSHYLQSELDQANATLIKFKIENTSLKEMIDACIEKFNIKEIQPNKNGGYVVITEQN